MGNFVVVWTSQSQDGSLDGVFSRRYDSDGAAVGTEFQVNTTTAQRQNSPTVAVDSGGGFVIVWYSQPPNAVFAQRYDSLGVTLGTEFQVGLSPQPSTAVSADASGGFVVIWRGTGLSGEEDGVFGRRYDSTGALVGSEFQVNTYTTAAQREVAVASQAGGGFVVVWHSEAPQFDGVFGQRFDSAGNDLGSEFEVSTNTTGAIDHPAVGAGPDGGFVVVWDDGELDGSASGVFGQRYDSLGLAVGTQFQANTYTTNNQYNPAIDVDASGTFIVLWNSSLQDGDENGVFGQRYDSSGGKIGIDFQINTYTTGWQIAAAVAARASGDFVVVWESFPLPGNPGQDGANRGVFGQRFSASVCGDGLVDGVTGEACDEGAANGTPDSCCTVGCVFQVNGTPCTDDGILCTDDMCNGSSEVCQHPSITPCESAAQTPAAGMTVTTDSELDGATGSDRVETSVTTPNAGTVTVVERNITVSPPPGYSFFGQQVGVTAPPATAANPLVLVFELDASIIPVGHNPSGVVVFRNGILVPNCTGAPGIASPDPCLRSRVIQGDLDVRLTVLTSTASEWTFGFEGIILDHYRCYQGKDLKTPAFVKRTVDTVDQITAGETVDVQKVKFVCVPVEMNGEAIVDPDTHVICYQVKAAVLEPRPSVEVSTQLQLSQFALKKPKLLCLPGVKTAIP
jgi:hypothetical protein